MNRSLNLAAFVVGWAACLWGAASGHPFAGPLVVGVLLAAQSFTMIDPRRTVGLVAVVAILGTVVDSVLLASGLYVVEQPLRGEWLCPLWITAIWINLGTALHGCLGFLVGHHILAVVIGTVAAPLAYVVAQQAGAIKIMASPEWALPMFALIGAATLPLVLWLSQSAIYRPRSASTAIDEG